eukprot:TRINITY_DN112268_c0_g1_i1.p1 TRINITY_DN112268_c0_g1~~TRINITY_DN112268_c0_g1_i1.p1  ORF type:complete len:1017 (-),score=272.01 TRINITY_DN112268_c0_g1_i1:10-3060(-)
MEESPGKERERKVYVTGLPRGVRDDDLRTYFEENVGPVTSAKAANGFGFAVFFERDDAVAATSKAFEHVLQGARIRVRGAAEDQTAAGKENPSLLVRGLPPTLDADALLAHFKSACEGGSRSVLSAKVEDGKDLGTVEFASEAALQSVLQKPQFILGQMLELQIATGSSTRDEQAHLDEEERDRESRVVVSGLPLDVDDEKLYQLFSKQIGAVKRAKVEVFRETGESRGRGSVTFKSSDDAEIATMQQVYIGGKALQISLDEGDDARAVTAHVQEAEQDRTIRVNKLPESMGDKALYDIFLKKHGGKVASARIATDKETGESRGFGFVVFVTHADAMAAFRTAHFHQRRFVELRFTMADAIEDEAARRRKRGLCVHGLPDALDDEGLHDYFSQWYQVQGAKIVVERETNKSRGFGFVLLGEVADARDVMTRSHFINRKMIEVRPDDGTGRPAEDESLRERTLHVRNLPVNTDDETLYSFLSEKLGHIESVRVLMDRETGKPRDTAFVVVGDAAVAQNALRPKAGREPWFLKRKMLDIQIKKPWVEGGAQADDAAKEKEAEEEAERNTRKLAVRGLPFTLDDQSLFEYFSQQAGTVESAMIMTVRETGESAGHGFVVLADATKADAVAQQVHQVQGKTIDVQLMADNRGPDCRRLFLRGLGFEVDDEKLRRYFTNCVGKVISARVQLDRITKESRGVGYVMLESQADAERALTMLHQIEGRFPTISVDEGPKGKGEGKGKEKQPEWECEHCWAKNFGNRRNCFKCKKPKGILGTYLVDNSQLNAKTPGLAYRWSKNMQDKDKSVAAWGSSVYGSDDGEGWLRLEDWAALCYLPTKLNDVQVLTLLEEGPRQEEGTHFKNLKEALAAAREKTGVSADEQKAAKTAKKAKATKESEAWKDDAGWQEWNEADSKKPKKRKAAEDGEEAWDDAEEWAVSAKKKKKKNRKPEESAADVRKRLRELDAWPTETKAWMDAQDKVWFDAKKLREGWIRIWSRSKDCEYYYCTNSGITTFDLAQAT